MVSLFTNISVSEAIDYIKHQIYNEKNWNQFALILNLATEVTFTMNTSFFIQTDGCTIGEPFSVIFSEIFMTKIENDIVNPTKPIFDRSYVDGI